MIEEEEERNFSLSLLLFVTVAKKIFWSRHHTKQRRSRRIISSNCLLSFPSDSSLFPSFMCYHLLVSVPTHPSTDCFRLKKMSFNTATHIHKKLCIFCSSNRKTSSQIVPSWCLNEKTVSDEILLSKEYFPQISSGTADFLLTVE
jgi:hypothetical protein